MITTGGTAAAIANMLRAHGARRVVFAATHGVLTGGAPDRLRSAPIDEVIVTDSIPIPPEKQGAPITVLSGRPAPGGGDHPGPREPERVRTVPIEVEVAI